MSLAFNTIFEMRPTNGVDTNGGGYVPGSSGTDYSQQNAAQYSLTGLTTSGASATIATTSAANDMVGNIIQITAGTNFTTGFYQIISVVVGTSITVDRNAATGVGAAGTGNIGGALKTFSKLMTAMNTGGTSPSAISAYIKAESTITSGSNLSINYGTTNAPCFIAGYTTSRTDGGQVTIQAITNTSFTLLSIDNNNNLNMFTLKNFILDCNNLSGVNALQLNSNFSAADNIKVINMNGATGFRGWNGVRPGSMRRCFVVSQSGGTGFDISAVGNNGNGPNISDCGVTGTSGSNPVPWNIDGGFYLRCFSANNTGASPTGVHGFLTVSGPNAIYFDSCVAYKNGGDGFKFAGLTSGGGNGPPGFVNCVSYGNGVNGFEGVGTNAAQPFSMLNDYNFVGSNTTANYSNITAGPNSQTLTADPFVNGTSNNFAPNGTAGGGALLNANGFPGVLPVGGTGFQTAGMLQPQCSGGSSGFLAQFNDTLNLSDSLILGYGLKISDDQSANWADNIQVGFISQSEGLSDTLSLSDSVAIQIIISFGPSDTLSLSDSVLLSIGMSLHETLPLADSMALILPLHELLIGDFLAMSDRIALAQTMAFNFSDSVNLSDALALVVGNFFSDQLALSDAVVVNVNANQTETLNDSLALSDNVTVLLSEPLNNYLRRYLNDVVM